MVKKILIADDDRETVEFLKSSLMRHNFEVVTAFDGEEAKQRIKQDKPDIIILDLFMPRLDGWGFLSWLRDEAKLTIPTIVLSAKDEIPEIKKTYTLGPDYYIIKPVKLKALIKGIHIVSSLKHLKNAEDEKPKAT